MGRHSIELSEMQKGEVETLAAVLTAGQMADYFGIGRTTFFAMVREDPQIAERYKRGKARAIGAIAQSLISKARAGDTTSTIFYLKTQAGWRETLQIDRCDEWRSGEVDLSLLSDEDLVRIIHAFEPPPALKDEAAPIIDGTADHDAVAAR